MSELWLVAEDAERAVMDEVFECYAYEEDLWRVDTTVWLEKEACPVVCGREYELLGATASGDLFWVSERQGVVGLEPPYESQPRRLASSSADAKNNQAASCVAGDGEVMACCGDVAVRVDAETADVRQVLAVKKGAACVATTDGEIRGLDFETNALWYPATPGPSVFRAVATTQGFLAVAASIDDGRVTGRWELTPNSEARPLRPASGSLVHASGGVAVSCGDHCVVVYPGGRTRLIPAMRSVVSARGGDARVGLLSPTDPAAPPSFAVASLRHGLSVFQVTGAQSGATLTHRLPDHAGRPLAIAALPPLGDRPRFAVLLERAVVVASLRHLNGAKSATRALAQEPHQAKLRTLDALDAMSNDRDW